VTGPLGTLERDLNDGITIKIKIIKQFLHEKMMKSRHEVFMV